LGGAEAMQRLGAGSGKPVLTTTGRATQTAMLETTYARHFLVLDTPFAVVGLFRPRDRAVAAAARMTATYNGERAMLDEALAAPAPQPVHIRGFAPSSLSPPFHEFAARGFDIGTCIEVATNGLDQSFLVLQSSEVPGRSLAFVEYAFEDSPLDQVNDQLLPHEGERIVRGFYDPNGMYSTTLVNALAGTEAALTGDIFMAKAIIGPRDATLRAQLRARGWPVVMIWSVAVICLMVGTAQLMNWILRMKAKWG